MHIRSFNLYCNIFTAAILLLLFAYHIVLYFGRRRIKKENSNIYFAFFVFSLSGYILTSPICRAPANHYLIVPIEAFFASTTFFFIARFFYNVLDQPFKKKFISILDIILLFGFLFSLTSLYFGLDIYLRTIFMWVVLVYMLVFLIIVFTFIWQILKQKIIREKHIKTIFIGFCLLILYLLVVKLIASVNRYNPYIYNHLFAGVAALLFGNALAQKSNKEFKELCELKNYTSVKNGFSFHIVKEKIQEYSLTPREAEIIEYVSVGFEYKEIADKLHISTRTVIRHTQNIFFKLNVHNKVEMLNKLSQGKEVINPISALENVEL